MNPDGREPPGRACRCGAPLPPDFPEAICPRCALEVGRGEAGRLFGGYELLDELGRGGMGVVRMAYHAATGRVVALKTPAERVLAEPDLLRRFHAEAEAVASLDHPGILPIYEISEHEGVPFFTMKLAEGGSLAGRMDAFPPKAAMLLVAAVAEAMQHAHARGILHRDLKPQNILLDAAGQPMVSDFGLARWLHRSPEATLDAFVIGTPAYMAPEQLDGRPEALTTAADLFSLGAILYHLVAGRAPFSSASVAATLKNLSASAPAAPAPLDRRLPADLERICRKCLAQNPADRYPSAADLAADLRRCAAGEPVHIRRVTPAERILRWGRRNPKITFGAALAALALAAAGITAITAQHRAYRAEIARADAAERLARSLQHEHLIEEARRIRTSGRIGQRFDALARLREAWSLRPDLRIRDAAIECLALPDLQLRGRIPLGGSHVAFGPDTFAVISPGGEILIRSLPDGALRRTLRPAAKATDLAGFDPTGTFLAVRTGPESCEILDVATGTASPALPVADRPPDLGFDSVALAPGKAYVLEPSGRVSRRDLATGETAAWPALPARPDGLAAAGDLVAVIYSRERRAEIRDSAGTLLHTLDLPSAIEAAAWNADASQLALTGLDKHGYIWDRASGKCSRRVSSRDSRTRFLSFADGWILSITRDNTLRLWEPTRSEDRLVEPLDLAPGQPAAWSRDARHLYLARNGALERYEVFLPLGPRWMRPDQPEERFENCRTVDISPDDRFAAVVTARGVRLWDLAGGRATGLIPKIGNEWMGARFSPDGRHLFIGGWNTGLIRYDLAQGHPGRAVTLPLDHGSVLVDASADGRWLGLLGNPDGQGQFVIWDVPRNAPALTLPFRAPFALTFRPAAAEFVTTAFDRPTVELRPVSTGAPLREWRARDAIAPAFRADGQRLFLPSHRGGTEWALTPGRPTGEIALDHPVRAAAYHPTRPLLVLEGPDSLVLVDPRTWTVVAHLPTPAAAQGSANQSFALSPDGKLIAVQTADGGLLRWDLPALEAALKSLGLAW